jgi:hypothetical protein
MMLLEVVGSEVGVGQRLMTNPFLEGLTQLPHRRIIITRPPPPPPAPPACLPSPLLKTVFPIATMWPSSRCLCDKLPARRFNV